MACRGTPLPAGTWIPAGTKLNKGTLIPSGSEMPEEFENYDINDPALDQYNLQKVVRQSLVHGYADPKRTGWQKLTP